MAFGQWFLVDGWGGNLLKHARQASEFFDNSTSRGENFVVKSLSSNDPYLTVTDSEKNFDGPGVLIVDKNPYRRRKSLSSNGPYSTVTDSGKICGASPRKFFPRKKKSTTPVSVFTTKSLSSNDPYSCNGLGKNLRGFAPQFFSSKKNFDGPGVSM